MGLTDFWDNITTPGFISASLEELKEMVLKGNKDYQTSIAIREDGRKLIV